MELIKDKIEQYANTTDIRFVMIGNEEQFNSRGDEEWFWGSGERITDSCCPGEPNSSLSEPFVWIDRHNDYCFRDAVLLHKQALRGSGICSFCEN